MIRKIFDKAAEAAARALEPLMRDKIVAELEKKLPAFGVERSNVCNARCSFCAYRLGYDKREKSIVTEKVLRKALDMFRDAGGASFSFISILGDPMTDKELLPNIKLIKSYPNVKNVNIYSNLIGFDNYDPDEFVTSGITILSVSICLGGAEMYKRLFGVDKYERVTQNLVSLLEANTRHGNPVKITLLVRMDYPAEKFYDRPLMEKISGHLTADKIDVLPPDMWDDYNGSVSKSEIPAGGVFRRNVGDKKEPCYALYRKMQVLNNGDIAVCSCRVSPQLVTGSIFDYKSIDDYWRGDALRKFRENWKNGAVPPVCAGCNHYLPLSFTVKTAIKDKIKAAARKLAGK
jgi:hypothetical protein